MRVNHERANKRWRKLERKRGGRGPRRWHSKSWAGCRGLTAKIIDAAIVQTKPRLIPRAVWKARIVSSRKRTETFGNPGSDHHVSQTTADAVDFRFTEAYGLRDRIMRRLGVPDVADFGNYAVDHYGDKIRVQPIAQTHGTGPHLHFGCRQI